MKYLHKIILIHILIQINYNYNLNLIILQYDKSDLKLLHTRYATMKLKFRKLQKNV